MIRDYLWALTVSENIEKCILENSNHCSSFHYLHQWENESFNDFCKRSNYVLKEKVHSTSEIIKKYKNNGMNGMLEKFPKGNKFYKADSNAFESLSEKLASILLKYSNLDPSSYITYDLVPLIIDNKYKVGCESLNFRNQYPYEQILFYIQSQESSSKTKLHTKTIFKIINSMIGIKPKFQLLTELVSIKTMMKEPEIEVRLMAMMAFDLLILNRDRHYGNLIFLDDLMGNVNPIPLIDYGSSVLGGVNSEDIRKNFFPKAESFSDIFKIVINQNDRMFNEPLYKLGEFTKSRNFYLYFDYERVCSELETLVETQLLYKPHEVKISIDFLLYCLDETEEILWRKM